MQSQATLALVETDMAYLAGARVALQDMEGWLLSLPHRKRVTPDDMMRVACDLNRMGAGLDTVRKYLAYLHREGWPERND